jgi:uncharacterized protein
MRSLPASFDASTVDAIDALLDDVVRVEGVRVLAAVESGSRAWGFPSPDSDYDCRFVYVRSADDYLSPWQRRDVVEWAPDGLLDVNGWDLKKAVQLLLKGNAAITEWLGSPMVYRSEPGFAGEFLALADEVGDRALVGRHYVSVGRQQWARFSGDGGTMPLKKLFYSVRPALAVRWLDQHPGAAFPPMTLGDLAAQTDLTAGQRDAIDELVALKAVTREMGTGAVPAVLAELVSVELRDRPWLEDRRTDLDATRAVAAEFFRHAVRTYAA